MGSVFKSVKNVVKKATNVVKKVVKPVTKVVKKVVKTVKKVGKAVAKGVAKVSNKLGPLGSIALAIAMPYALSGLSSLTTGLQGFGLGTATPNSAFNLFVRSVGNVGNTIRTGYQGFNTFVGNATSSITKSISNTFTRFAPKGTGNFFSNISQGAKNLYNAAKNKLKSVMPKPFTAKEGTVKFYDMDGVGTMTSTQAEAAITRGTLDPSMLGEQTLTETGGWFTKPNQIGVTSDNLVTETINEAYKNRLDGFGPNATRMFDDIKRQSIEMGTYINDEQIGSFIENNSASKTYSEKLMNYTGDMDYTGTSTFKVKTEVPNLGTTGDYRLVGPIEGGGDAANYVFNGAKTFEQPATSSFLSKAFKAAGSAGKDTLKGLLAPKALSDVPLAQPYQPNFEYTGLGGSMYEGTDITGSKGGELVAKVYGENKAKQLKDYYKNMNILNSEQTYA